MGPHLKWLRWRANCAFVIWWPHPSDITIHCKYALCLIRMWNLKALVILTRIESGVENEIESKREKHLERDLHVSCVDDCWFLMWQTSILVSILFACMFNSHDKARTTEDSWLLNRIGNLLETVRRRSSATNFGFKTLRQRLQESCTTSRHY